MDPNTKKYLTYGGIGLAGFLVYKRWRHEDQKLDELNKKDKAVKKDEPMLTPAQIAAQAPMPSTASQFSPVGPIPYPQQYPAQYPVQYPAQYPVQYPVQYPQPVQNCQIIAQSLVGQTLAAARQILYYKGITPRVVSINNRQMAQPYDQPYGPTAYLTVFNNIVRAATCRDPRMIYGVSMGNQPYPATAY